MGDKTVVYGLGRRRVLWKGLESVRGWVHRFDGFMACIFATLLRSSLFFTSSRPLIFGAEITCPDLLNVGTSAQCLFLASCWETAKFIWA